MNTLTLCSLCDRPTPEQYVEKHHIVPVSKGGKDTVKVCVACGDQIHQLFENRELKYMSFEDLKNHPKVLTWINWIKKKRDFVVCMKRKK